MIKLFDKEFESFKNNSNLDKMASNIIDLGDALNKCADNLHWRVLEKQAKIILHTGDCNRYSFFFADEPSQPIKHPCLLGYKNWSVVMGAKYLDVRSDNCSFLCQKSIIT